LNRFLGFLVQFDKQVHLGICLSALRNAYKDKTAYLWISLNPVKANPILKVVVIVVI